MPSTGRTYRRLVSLVMFRLTVVKRKGIVKGQWWRTDRLILSAPNNLSLLFETKYNLIRCQAFVQHKCGQELKKPTFDANAHCGSNVCGSPRGSFKIIKHSTNRKEVETSVIASVSWKSVMGLFLIDLEYVKVDGNQ